MPSYLRALIRLLAVATLLVLAGTSAAAAAPADAALTGTVTRGDTGAPVAGAEVLLIGDEVFLVAVTDADGRYAIPEAPAGDYRVRFVPPPGSDLTFVFWDGAATFDDADILTLPDGEARTGVDGVLPLGGTISGTVTRAADGTAVPDVTVWVDGDGGSTSVVTDAAGRYTAVGLGVGEYLIEFAPPIIDDQPPELAPEYYDDARSPDAATRVPVAPGGAAVGIDAALEATGAISGTVTRSDTGAPVAGVLVSAETTAHTSSISAVTAADGGYTIAGVGPGTHFVAFGAPDDDGLLDQFWPGVSDFADAEPVTVAPGTTTPGIDAVLEAAGSISGSVRFDGYPWTDGGTVLLTETGAGEPTASTAIGDDGTYRIGKVPAGTYTLQVRPRATAARAALQYYAGAAGPKGATPLVVTGGDEVTGIDVALAAGVDIAGRVAAAVGELTEPAQIRALRWDGTEWEEIARATAWAEYSFAHPPGDVEGFYLPTGTYLLAFAAEGMCPLYWDGARTQEAADRLVLEDGRSADGIDAVLAATCEEPVIVPGDPAVAGLPRVGETLTADPGTWLPADVTLRYQWLRDGKPLKGATDPTLTLTPAHKNHLVSVRVTGSRDGLPDAAAESAPVGPVTRAPEVSLSARSIQRGALLTVSGTGFAPAEEVVIELHSTPVELARTEADAAGSLRMRVRIPEAAALGPHEIVVTGPQSTARLAVRVVAGGLAATGGTVPTPLAAAGAIAAAAGVLLTLWARGRRRGSRAPAG